MKRLIAAALLFFAISASAVDRDEIVDSLVSV